VERDPRPDPKVADLVEALRSYGALTRDALREQSGASRWITQSFEGALRRGVADGSIKSIGGDLFEVGDRAPDPEQGRFDPS
jgi:hypothetical protein